MTGSEHKVELCETRIFDAVREMIEDRLADVVRHSLKATTEAKPSTITIKITVTPHEDRQMYGIQVSNACSLAPQKPFTDQVMGGQTRACGAWP